MNGSFRSASGNQAGVYLWHDDWALAKKVCTARQLQALDWARHGAGRHRIGLMLGLDPGSARDLVQAGMRKLERAKRADASGTAL
jgi:DNA-binding CsgD family transcriptional regulator